MRSFLMACVAGGLVAGSALADDITVFSDRAGFEIAAGVPLTVEDFTDTFHFPITTGVLNSETDLPGIGIFPGTIKSGVTYSTSIGVGNFFNIDAGGGYEGGFLDGFEPSDRDVTIDFHGEDPGTPRAVNAFGFDFTSLCIDTTDVTISFSAGPDQKFTVQRGSNGFAGFVSDRADITSVVVSNNGCFFGFDFDNFTYTEVGSSFFSLSYTGSCPGSVSLEVSGATPNSPVALIFAARPGSFVIPNNLRCAGTQLGLSNAGIRLVNQRVADANGNVTFSGFAPSAACGGELQVLDLTTCATTNTVSIR